MATTAPSLLHLFCSYFNAFEKQLLSPGLANYSAFVAPGSLVDWFLANELVKSANDGYRGSVYFWKDADSVCKAEGKQPACSSPCRLPDGNLRAGVAVKASHMRKFSCY